MVTADNVGIEPSSPDVTASEVPPANGSVFLKLLCQF